MFMVVWTFLALALTAVIYAWLGQGGGVSGIIFFGTLLIAVLVKIGLGAVAPSAPDRERPGA